MHIFFISLTQSLPFQESLIISIHMFPIIVILFFGLSQLTIPFIIPLPSTIWFILVLRTHGPSSVQKSTYSIIQFPTFNRSGHSSSLPVTVTDRKLPGQKQNYIVWLLVNCVNSSVCGNLLANIMMTILLIKQNLLNRQG